MHVCMLTSLEDWPEECQWIFLLEGAFERMLGARNICGLARNVADRIWEHGAVINHKEGVSMYVTRQLGQEELIANTCLVSSCTGCPRSIKGKRLWKHECGVFRWAKEMSSDWLWCLWEVRLLYLYGISNTVIGLDVFPRRFDVWNYAISLLSAVF